MPQRLVIARAPEGGFGDHLTSLLAAWAYAKDTGRSLLVDWRGSRYCWKQDLDLFRHIYQLDGSFGTVPLLSLNEAIWAEVDSCFPGHWNAENLRECVPEPVSASLKGETAAVLSSGVGRPEHAIVVAQSMEDALPTKEQRHAAFEILKLRSSYGQSVHDFARRFEGYLAVGLHVRHGNGEDLLSREWFWPTRQARPFEGTSVSVLGQILEKLEGLREESELSLVVFLSTDSTEVEQVLRGMIPELICVAKLYRPVGEGPLHGVGNSQRERVVGELLLESHLLSCCDRVIYIPSGFSLRARSLLDDSHLFELRAPQQLTTRYFKSELRRNLPAVFAAAKKMLTARPPGPI